MKSFLSIIIISITIMLSNAKAQTGIKLGTLSQITISTKDLNKSVEFWKKLGFTIVFHVDSPIPWTQISDGSILVYLIEDKDTYIRLSYFNPKIADKLDELEKAGIKIISRTNDAEGKLYRGIISSPDNFEIAVVNRDPMMLYHPPKKTMLTTDTADYHKADKMQVKLGLFGEFSQPVKDLKAAMAFYKKIGFKEYSVNEMPYPWAIMEDSVIVVGLHQTNDFSTPTMTYFAPDMKQRIEKLKAEGVEVHEMGYGPANVYVLTPEGTKLFLFEF
jgi:predicted lactoylglutathione lyase